MLLHLAGLINGRLSLSHPLQVQHYWSCFGEWCCEGDRFSNVDGRVGNLFRLAAKDTKPLNAVTAYAQAHREWSGDFAWLKNEVLLIRVGQHVLRGLRRIALYRAKSIGLLKAYPPQSESIRHDTDAAKGHRSGSQNRAELAQKRRRPLERGQHPGGDGDEDDVVAEGPEQVLVDVAHRRPRQMDGLGHAAQVAAHERHVGRLHRHVRPGAVLSEA